MALYFNNRRYDMKRFIALTLALVMLCCCAAGCGSDTKEDTVMTAPP